MEHNYRYRKPSIYNRMLKKFILIVWRALCPHNNALSEVSLPRTHRGKSIFNYPKYCVYSHEFKHDSTLLGMKQQRNKIDKEVRLKSRVLKESRIK